MPAQGEAAAQASTMAQAKTQAWGRETDTGDVFMRVQETLAPAVGFEPRTSARNRGRLSG